MKLASILVFLSMIFCRINSEDRLMVDILRKDGRTKFDELLDVMNIRNVKVPYSDDESMIIWQDSAFSADNTLISVGVVIKNEKQLAVVNPMVMASVKRLKFVKAGIINDKFYPNNTVKAAVWETKNGKVFVVKAIDNNSVSYSLMNLECYRYHLKGNVWIK